MSERFYVPIRAIEPTSASNSVHNEATHVGLGVSHFKSSKAVHLTAYPVERRGDGIETFIITSGESMVLEAMPRLNRKRLEILESAVRNEISAECGRAWDLVQRLCHKRGYVVVAPAPAPMEV